MYSVPFDLPLVCLIAFFHNYEKSLCKKNYREVINNEQENQGYDIHEARLVKKKGLGLSIIGRR